MKQASKFMRQQIGLAVISASILVLPEHAQALIASGFVDSIPNLIQAGSVDCGEKFIPLSYYEQGSFYAAIDATRLNRDPNQRILNN